MNEISIPDLVDLQDIAAALDRLYQRGTHAFGLDGIHEAVDNISRHYGVQIRPSDHTEPSPTCMKLALEQITRLTHIDPDAELDQIDRSALGA